MAGQLRRFLFLLYDIKEETPIGYLLNKYFTRKLMVRLLAEKFSYCVNAANPT